MKKVLLLLFLYPTISFAQNADSANPVQLMAPPIVNNNIEQRTISLNCPANTIGSYLELQERELKKERNFLGQEYMSHGPWKSVSVNNSCSYYLKAINEEFYKLSCTTPQKGEVLFKRNIEIWSDNSKRNASEWVQVSGICE